MKREEEEATKAGKPYFSQLVLQKWHRDRMNHVVEYAVRSPFLHCL